MGVRTFGRRMAGMGAANDLQESRRVASPLFGWGIGREGGREGALHSFHGGEGEESAHDGRQGRKEGRQLLPFNSLGKVDRPFEGERRS